MDIMNLYEDYLNSEMFDKKVNDKAHQLVVDNRVTLLSYSTSQVDFLVMKGKKPVELSIVEDDDAFVPMVKSKIVEWKEPQVAAIIYLVEHASNLFPVLFNGKKYTREGMIHRVTQEREKKSKTGKYKIQFADNIFGEHTLYNEKGVKYILTLRDFDKETGYVDSHDLKVNKLGTTKHLMFAFRKLKKNRPLFRKLSKQYPFIEIYLDPLNEYKITWHYPDKLPRGVQN